MKTLWSYFRLGVANGLQYRAAAWAGAATQFAWGAMTLLMFRAFYAFNPAALPMPYAALSSYIWLQQAFLALFAAWSFDMSIFQSIEDGGVAYELCRPVSLYRMWFVRNVSRRVSAMLLRSLPIFLVTVFLPAPYALGPPASLLAGLVFLPSLVLALLVAVGFVMFTYLSAFYTLSSQGVRILLISVIEFLSGAYIPLAFFPDGIRRVVSLLPFASMQNAPLMIYAGYYQGGELLRVLALQVFWVVALLAVGSAWMKRALQRVVVQGG